MPTTSLKTAARRCALAATIGVGAFVAAPSAASAAGTNACDASALQLSLLGGVALDPIHANPSYAPCVSADGTLIDIPELLGLVGAQAVTATTRNTANVNAVSESRVAGVKVGVNGVVGDVTNLLLTDVNGVGNQLLTQINNAVWGVPVLGPLLTSVLGAQQLDLPGLVAGLTGPLTSSLQAQLPDILSAGVITSTAQAQCVNGVAQLSGSSRYEDLQVLGLGVDANQALDTVLDIDTAALNLGGIINAQAVLQGIKLDQNGPLAPVLGVLIGNYPNLWALLTDPPTGVVRVALDAVLLPVGGVAGLTNLLIGPGSALQQALNDITIPIPEGLLHAKVTPRAQAVVGDQLTQQTLAISVSALGQPILSGTLAQARVGAGAPGCVPPVVPPKPEEPKSPVKNPDKYTSPEAEAFLQCANRAIDLIDVFGQGSRTFVQGVAERKYVGKTATIYLAHGKKKVGTVKVGEDGLFSTKVALPPKKIRKTNKARYYAVIDGKKTRALKFARRMETRGLTASSDSVTFRGRVVGPLQKRQQKVTIKQRITCKSYKTVATVKPDSKGRFTVKIKAPAGDGAVIYRAQTKVGKRKNAKRLSPTFTLPRVVGLR